jgi:hypothetical protein
MKSFRIVMLSVVLMSFATAAFAQSDAETYSAHAASKPVAKSDAQVSFTLLKALAGTWQASSVTLDPPQPEMGSGMPMQVSLRVTSRGNALVHEMGDMGNSGDPTLHDHPVTMFYLDGDRLLLTHYCDAGNRPRMAARTPPDGKTVEFDFVDVAGGTQHGHMHHAVFTIIDAKHHIEDWTYMMPGDKLVHAHLDLTRAQ